MRAGTPARLTTASLMAAALTLGLAAPSLADYYGNDDVYADSFGNLVIEGASGYKRIVVGEGHQAKQLSESTGNGPNIIYANRFDDTISERDCYRPPVLVKGRSYMYGFDQGVIPLQGGPCQ